MNTEDGLFVPVLRDAGSRGEEDLRGALEAMKKDIAARTVPPDDLRGQTITLSNFGMIGGRYAVLVIMPPQVAIIGAGRITEEAKVIDGKIKPCRILPLSLTFDHRAVTGAEATRFLMSIVNELEG
jgi:pyruvate dehydrogenase E2 component (dihydrolipoamide acetyltransferase)